MTEEEAREAAHSRLGPAGAGRLDAFVTLLVEENQRQNLISPGTVPSVWSRHIIDSLQLLDLADSWTTWLDVGTGGGFPGMVIALADLGSTTLVEPRRRRADFLQHAATALRLTSVTVVAAKVEQVTAKADIISARAVAPVEKLLPAALHCATAATTWILPRGQIGVDELDSLRSHWRGMFHVEPSVTDPRSSIVIAKGVAPR